MTRQIAIKRTSGRKWLSIRKAILNRDCGLCQVCKAQGKLTVATEVDHITQIADGGTDDYCNLQAICHDCHADKTARDNGKRRRVAIGADGWPIAT